MQFLTENELKIHIKKCSVAPCYLLFGQEKFLVKRYSERLVEVSITANPDFNLNYFENEVQMQTVYDAVNQFPMMADKRAVVLSDPKIDDMDKTEFSKLIETVKSVPPTTLLVVAFNSLEINEKKPSERAKSLFEAVASSSGEVCNLARKQSGELVKMIQSGAAKRLCRIETTTAKYMIECCSDDLTTLLNELEKLCAFVGNGNIITTEHIDKICSRTVEFSIYNLSKAIMRKDLKEALKILDGLYYVRVEPIIIVSNLSNCYIDLYIAFTAKNSGTPMTKAAKDFGYYNTAFRLNNAERSLNRFSEKRILESMKQIHQCDCDMKSSKTDERILIENLIVNLVYIAGNEKYA